MDLEIQRFSLTDLSKQTENRIIITKLLHLCCAFDAVACATTLLKGEFGLVPLINERDSTGLTPLHAAATANAARCVKMLLEKHARTDLKSRDERRLLPLELSLCSTRKNVIWNLDDNSTIEDLVVQISEKDLTTLKLLADKTKDIGDVAYKMAEAGRVVDLAALLVAATDKIHESILPVRDADLDCKEKTTIYEAVIREALALGAPTPSLRAAKRVTVLSESERSEKRKLLLYVIELLQHFGVVDLVNCTDMKLPIIRAAQAGDETIIELLLKTNIDLNDVDADGHSALHWCLKAYKQSCPQQMKIMRLLLKHGARVNQKNRLGLTAVHIAASNGNSQALQALLLKDPDCINSNTEMKETPLFYAVKNGYKDCVEVLLHWGASTGVFNLRKQRPVDLAESQDMRFMLRNTDVNLAVNRPLQPKYKAWLQGDDEMQGTCKEVSNLTDEGNPADRTCSITSKVICKYFRSPRGCVRGTMCFYAHSEEEPQQVKQGRYMMHSPDAGHPGRRIFVGGLPACVDSDSLRENLEERFGSVDDAVVLGVQTADKMQSRGFGFVTFKDKKSVSAAVEARHVTIMGKQIEIKTATPKLQQAEFQESTQQRETNEIFDEKLPQAQTPKERTEREIPSEKAKTDVLERQASPGEKTEKVILGCNSTEGKRCEPRRTWADTLIHGQPKACSGESQAQERCMPRWFRTFRRWLPSFLQQVSKRGGQYALSSVKADFRAAFGLELDHASLGFSKLSDFIKSVPQLCHTTYHSPANHMILLPSLLIPCQQQPTEDATMDSPSSGHGSSDGPHCSQEPLPEATENDEASDGSTRVSCGQVSSRFLQFLIPDPIFHARPWVKSDSGKGFREMEPGPQGGGRHLVLEALARKKSSIYFLREFDFCDKYKASIAQGRCLGCNERRVLWANFPCLHVVWCADCRLQAMMVAARVAEHKCVVCDIKVQRVDLTSRPASVREEACI
ncbi:hypothetical protein OIU76_029858 [Salix suchowensis]|nr:hypothetical protein OIU76_029858 [Salix suchowensis]